MNSLLLSVLSLLAAQAAAPTADILGRWEGTSICVKAEWNAACNDEVTRYDIVRKSATGDTVTSHSYKQVNGAWEEMGDLDFAWDPASKSWRAPFRNARVNIVWVFNVAAPGMLTGRVLFVADARVGRTVRARRVGSAPG